MSQVLVVVARRFNGHELWVSLGVLIARGFAYDLVSTDVVIQDEITQDPFRIQKTLEEVSYDDDYLGMMLISGNMADTEAYWRNPRVLSLLEQFNNANKPIAAICCSVPSVRNVAKGKKVSFFPLVRSRQLLEDAGAILMPEVMTRDQNLVTAEHQMVTETWVTEFCNVIEDKPQEFFFSDSGFRPPGRMARPIPELEALKG